MEVILKISAIAVISLLVAVLIRKSVPEISLSLMLAAEIVIVAFSGGLVGRVVEYIKELAALGGISGELLSPLLKTAGIATVAKLAADVCRDGGASSIASYIELCGGAAAIIYSFPLMIYVLEFI